MKYLKKSPFNIGEFSNYKHQPKCNKCGKGNGYVVIQNGEQLCNVCYAIERQKIMNPVETEMRPLGDLGKP